VTQGAIAILVFNVIAILFLSCGAWFSAGQELEDSKRFLPRLILGSAVAWALMALGRVALTF